MRKQNLLKLAFTMLAMIVMTGAWAQEIPTQYTQDETEDIVQTENIPFRIYVEPDLLYNPNWVAPAWTLSGTSRWTFTFSAGLTPTAPVVNNTAINQNWVEITPPAAPADPAASPFTVDVVESNTALAGTCVDGGRTQTIYVIPEPTAVITDLGDLTASGWTGAAFDYSRCAVAADAIAVPNFDITFTENALRVANAYDYILTVTRAGYDINDTEIIAPADVTADFGKAAMQAIADYDASPITHSTANTMSLLTDGGGDLVRTQYVFTLANISSQTSYLSYFRENTGFAATIVDNYFAVAGQTVSFWLEPAPVTGPIYHIPNTYAF